MKDEQKTSLDFLRELASHRYDKDSKEKIMSLISDIRKGNLKPMGQKKALSPRKIVIIVDSRSLGKN